MISQYQARRFLKLPLALAIGMLSFSAQQASAHGYIESPKSRAFLCSYAGGTKNTNCGAVMYEPQSVEHFESSSCPGKGFFACGPTDGKIASGGLNSFSKLDEQTSSRWVKNSIKPGPNTFTWHYTAQHRTRDYQFFITKKDWNPNQPLTRNSFEKTPLLEQPWHGEMPGTKTSHTVNIPSDRNGYHVVLAVWKVGDNSNAFYQVVDVNIDNPGAGSKPVDDSAKSAWSAIGNLQGEALAVGDKVRTRVFSDQGEELGKQVTLEINSANLAKADQWPLELAKKVNAANLGYQIGELDDKDRVIPGQEQNRIFARNGSGITSVIIDKVLASTTAELGVSGLQAEYLLKDGQADLHFNAIIKDADPNDSYFLRYGIYDSAGKRIKFQQGTVGDLAPHFSTTLENMQPGTYDLVLVASSKRGQLLQQTLSFTLKPATSEEQPVVHYDYKYPEGIKGYTAGTLVLQPTDGHVYECKPSPFSAYCKMPALAPGHENSSWEWGWTRH
ncbi:N-acetylglucosamine-binding protein GbpA [Pseudomonas sp. NFXW11]|uniref:N-acetylglucosamine-binding protein GbpA n=1 Tax=Pseudomonas sp. NFXW11 TaxID=2819531 RepID=UPI003CF3D276